ncbi:MAG: ANTAR domain-containing protein [bacterium]
MLHLTLAQLSSGGADVCLPGEHRRVLLTAWAGLAPQKYGEPQRRTGRTAIWERRPHALVVRQENARTDWRFRGIAEFVRHRLPGLATPLARLLAGFKGRRRLEAELEQVRQELALGRLLDRTKGVCRSRAQWTGKQAYFHIRRLSRKRRTPMRGTAAQIVHRAAHSRGASLTVQDPKGEVIC